MSKHLTKLCYDGIIDRYPLNIGKKRHYYLPIDSEIALLLDDKKFNGKDEQGSELRKNIRLVLLRLTTISYTRFLDPKRSHGPGTIYFPQDKNGKIVIPLGYEKISPDPVPDIKDHLPVGLISEDYGVLPRDLRRPHIKIGERVKLFSQIPLPSEVVNRCISILTTKTKPPLVAKTANGYRIITDNYPTLKEYVNDWLILLLQVISRLEYTWQNLRKERREEIKWYDRIFGESPEHRYYYQQETIEKHHDLDEARINKKYTINLTEL